jgi:hypothetical protein
MKNGVIISVLFFLTSCSGNESKQIPLDFESDLIPEGIAIDPGSRTIFLSSLRHSKIVKCNLDGSAATNFIASHQDHFLPGFGMTIKGDTLFALGNTLPKHNGRSVLLLLNIHTGQLINSFSPIDSTFKYLNDLAISRTGDVFITDSESNKLYSIPRATGVMEIFMDSPEIANSNGITISEDGRYLYLASDKHGIRVLEIASKKIINEPNPGFGGIDGMKYFRHSLIAIVNGKRDERDNGVYRFLLNPENTAIIEKKRLIAPGEDFVLPTTFSILHGELYFVIDSQLANFDGEHNQIIDSARLKKYTLLKFKMD